MKLERLVATVVAGLLLAVGCYAHGLNLLVAGCGAPAETTRSLSSFAEEAVIANNGLRKCLGAEIVYHWYTALEPSFLHVPVWDFGQALESSLALSELPHHSPGIDVQVNDELQALDWYWDGQSNPPGYNSTPKSVFGGTVKYYDDNDWIALALLQEYGHTDQSWLLERAKEIFRLEQFGATNTEQLPNPGGVYWTQAEGNQYRATVSSAGAVQVALQLYLLTRETVYLQFAKTIYNWINSTLRDSSGMFWDGIDGDGKFHREEYSYNQGLMIGDNVLFYLATGDRSYLGDAERIKAAALVFYGAADRLWQQPPAFDAVFFQNLLALEKTDHIHDFRTMLNGYAERLAENLNDAGSISVIKNATGLEAHQSVLEQSEVIQVLAYASQPDPA